MIPQEYQKYVGKSYTFDDGNSITIIQIKRRDEEEYWVTYQTVTGPGVHKFSDHYGHLFE